jgi:uncharacterized protein (TIGR02246 family)
MMILTLLSVVSLAVSGLQTPQAASARVEDAIAQLETTWNEAHLHNDAAALDRLWAPGLTVIVPEMPLLSKPDLLKMWRSMKLSFSEYATTAVEVHVFGETAVVTGRLHRSRDFGGRAATEDWLFTKTYAQLDGQWKVVAYHASIAPKP